MKASATKLRIHPYKASDQVLVLLVSVFGVRASGYFMILGKKVLTFNVV
jgi:hypothetical protein